MKKTFLILLSLFIFSSCSMFSSSSSRPKTITSGVDQGSYALCEDGYWSPTGYQNCISCSGIAHSTGQSSTDRKRCECDTAGGYIWDYGLCIICSLVPCPTGTWSVCGNVPEGGSCSTCPTDSTANSTRTGCTCTIGTFVPGANKCQCPTGEWSLDGYVPSGGSCGQCPDANDSGVTPAQAVNDHTACACASSSSGWNGSVGACGTSTPTPTCTSGSWTPATTCNSGTESSCCSTGVCSSSQCTCTATSQCLTGNYCSLSPIQSPTSLCEQKLDIGDACYIQEQCTSGWCYSSAVSDPHANPSSGTTGVCKTSGELLADGAFCTASAQCVSATCGTDGKCGGAPGQSCSDQTGANGCRTGYYCQNLLFTSGCSSCCGWNYPTYVCTAKILAGQSCGVSCTCAINCINGHYFTDINHNGVYDTGEPLDTANYSFPVLCK